MYRLKKITLFCALMVLFFGTQGLAATFTFNDDYNEWPGIATALNGQDAYGNPEILGADVTLENGYLKQINIKFLAEQGIGLWYKGDFNSLFINRNGTGSALTDWDYYVRGYLPGAAFNASPVEEADFSTFEAQAYALSTSAGYAFTYPSSLSHDGGLLFRDDHPNGLEGVGPEVSGLLNSVILPDKSSIVLGSGEVIEIKYTFSDNAILMGSSFAIGYTPYSAGDVILGTVPEPSTFALIGAGLSLGLCVLRRKKNSSLS